MDTLEQELKQLIVSALQLEDLSPEDIGIDEPLFGETGLVDVLQRTMDGDGCLRVGPILDRVFERVRLPLEDDLTAVHIRRLGGES